MKNAKNRQWVLDDFFLLWYNKNVYALLKEVIF